MFRILSLFRTFLTFAYGACICNLTRIQVASREKSSELDEQTNDEAPGERLVRVPIEELQPGES